jgi:cytoskeletal protein CcmA (bactofilin family)
MDNLKIEGVTTTQGGTFDRVKIDGVCTINGDITAERIDIDGVTTVEGSVYGGNLECNGTATIRGSVEVKEIDAGGVLTIEGTMRARQVNIDGCIRIKGSKVEAERIECDGYLKIDGELNAEIIEAEGYINASEIVGERIVIRSKSSKFLTFLRRFKFDLGTFDFIEATQVDLTKVQAKTVHGHDIVIGKKCDIATIDCSGTLHIDPSAKVETITGDYKLV